LKFKKLHCKEDVQEQDAVVPAAEEELSFQNSRLKTLGIGKRRKLDKSCWFNSVIISWLSLGSKQQFGKEKDSNYLSFRDQ
jgi:hypothetical protein